MTYKRHPVSENDFAVAFDLLEQCWKPTVIKQGHVWAPDYERNFHYKDFRKNGIDIVTVDDKAVGLLGVNEKPDELYLRQILFTPDHQGKGTGTEIIRDLQDEAVMMGKPLTLETHANNFGAQRFYQRHGFVITGENSSGTRFTLRWSRDTLNS